MSKVRLSLLLDLIDLGVGHQFDVMEFDHEFARNNLLLPRKAVYASPFDLNYYMKLKEVSNFCIKCLLLFLEHERAVGVAYPCSLRLYQNRP
jgi:hypothetical protein